MRKSLSKGDRFHTLTERLKEIRTQGVRLTYEMGKILKEVKDDELWKAGYGSFVEYFSDPELGFKQDSVYRSIQLVEKFELEEVVRVPLRKVYALLPHVNNSNKEKLLTMATTLSTSDLRHELTAPQIPAPSTLPKIYSCNQCSGVKGITWDRLCHCGWTTEQIVYISKLIDRVNLGGD